jgi:hypothetical protein
LCALGVFQRCVALAFPPLVERVDVEERVSFVPFVAGEYASNAI